MPRQIIIENNMIREVEVTVVAEAALDDLVTHLTTAIPTALPVLPRNPKYVSFDPRNNSAVIMVERAPRRTTIKTDTGNFKLQFPYQYFLYLCSYSPTEPGRRGNGGNFSINGAYLFWRKEPYRDEEDLLWKARLANVGSDASICWGNTFQNSDTLNAQIDRLTDGFDDTMFNGDLGYTSPDYGNNYRAWEEASENPAVYLNWEFWNTPATTLREWLTRFISDPPLPSPDLSNTFIRLPEFPTNFTTGRAIEWLGQLSATQRKRMIIASAMVKTPRVELPPDPTADPFPPADIDSATPTLVLES